jgi:hypothetical protein
MYIYYCRNFKNYRLLRIQSGSGQEFLRMSAISTASWRWCDVHDSATIQGCSRQQYENVFFLWRCDPTRIMPSSFLRFLDHTQRRTTAGRTPLDEWSARRRDLYLTTHNTHNRQTFMPPVGFEIKFSVGERPQTYALDRAATGTGMSMLCLWQIQILLYVTRPIAIFITNLSA